MDDIPLPKVFHLIEPGPVVLVATAHHGRNNVMTMSWHMVMEFDPPRIGCIIGPWDHSFTALRETGVCVISVPTVDMVRAVVDIGNCSGRDVDKFATFGLTPLPAQQVGAPLVAECLANLECRVADAGLVERYDMFVLEVVKGWIDPHREERRTFHANGNGTFTVDGEVLDLRDRMVMWRDML